MYSSKRLLPIDATGIEIDCFHQLGEDRDLEPEICHCLPHGSELPCGRCDQAMQSWKEERTVA